MNTDVYAGGESTHDVLRSGPDCLDTTKNRSRRWCSMDDCGTQQKARRYVAKRAAARERP